MKSVGVYLGANSGNHSSFSKEIIVLGKNLAQMNLTLVYGGSSQGLMGQLATEVKKHGGTVIGVITNQLIEKEQPLTNLDELHIVDSMHARKQFIQKNSDSFIVVPGGLGTLEEAFDTWNAIKIGLIDKPIGFLNINGYFNRLFEFITTCAQYEFISNEQANIPLINEKVFELLSDLNHAHALLKHKAMTIV